MRDSIRDENGRPLRYAERDVIGVEGPGETHRRGINAELDALRDQHERQTKEHHPLGYHLTTQVAQVFLDVRSVGGAPECTDHSYARGQYSATVAEVNRIGLGTYEILLSESLGTTHLAIADVSMVRSNTPLHPAFVQPPPVRMRLGSVAAGDELVVQRYERDTAGNWDLADGDFAILIYAEVV